MKFHRIITAAASAAAGASLADYHAVSIYCRRFHVSFGSAALKKTVRRARSMTQVPPVLLAFVGA